MKKHWYKFFKKRKIEKHKLKFVSWFDNLFKGKYCWTDCVSFAFSPERFNPFRIESSKGCEIESIKHQHKLCYCGGWQNGKCFAKLSKEEQNKIREEMENTRPIEPPF
jgi:hypothetical protein